jgi:alpha-L-rhamnosidase
MGWMGDAQVFAPTAARNADVAAFFTKWLVDVDDGQGPQGEFNNVSPRANQNQSYPVWGDAGVVIPWVMYTSYGDKAFIESNYEHMRRWVDYEAHRYTNLLPFGGVGDHLAPFAARGGAGAAGGGRGPSTSAATGTAPTGRGFGRGAFAGPNTTSVVDAAYFAHSAQIVSRSATLLGKTDDAQKYDRLLQDIVAAFNKAYVHSDGSMVAGTQTTYCLALNFDLLPENLRPLAIQHLVDDISQRGHLSTGFVGVGQLNHTLTSIGRSDLAWQLLLTDTYPSWLFTIRNGATTIWERWDGWTPDSGFQDSSMNSFNHYSLGSVGEWLYSGAGGIRLDDTHPGYKHFILAPQITPKLSFVKATFNSPYGLISSYWHDDDGHMLYEATVPPNTTATLQLPGESSSKELPAGTYRIPIHLPPSTAPTP